MSFLPRVLCLAGPTGAGKTAAALFLATSLHGEIVNTDSRQVYADFPLITAQPNEEERAVCPHHLYGFLESHEKLSAGRFVSLALEKIQEISKKDKIPILVGGTGLYFKALLDGISAIPSVPLAVSEELLQRCAAQGAQALYKELAQIDAAYAARIHPNDKQRIMRALEVFVGTGKTFSWWHENVLPQPMVQGLYMATDMGLDILTPRLAKRIDTMLRQGAMEEARRALEKCSDKDAPGWSGIGCQELYAHMCQGVTYEKTLETWRNNTRAYAKRQLTWFKADKRILWFAPQDVQGMVGAARVFLQQAEA